jgi:type II secretory pathway pseudopilin PulG
VTLLEVLLVLALLVIIAGTAWPALESSLTGYRLRKAAEQVRVAWSRARIESLSSGQTVSFRFMSGDRQYAIERSAEPQYLPGGAAASSPSEGLDAGAAAGSPRWLPEGITFVDAEIEDAAGWPLAATAAGAVGLEWSEPIEFYPDGTTSTARLRMANDRGQTIEVALRVLTGVAAVGELYAEESLR